MEPLVLAALLAQCAPLVHPHTAAALIATESTANPNAIGVVGGQLLRQPRNRAEALATVAALEANGWDYSAGLAQINRRNFAHLGLTVDEAFEPCNNLAAMQTLLLDCFRRADRLAATVNAQASVRRALSCYYSGNFVTGVRHGYVARVVRSSMTLAARPP